MAAVAIWLLANAPAAQARACVWKLGDAAGHVLYLGGSVHALRSTDYPLPPAYNRAFEAADRIAFEVDGSAMQKAARSTERSAHYPRGDSLRNHVDPRTYDYLRRVFARMKVPENKYSIYRPWFLALLLQSPQLHGFSPQLGVEGFLERRARANHKPIEGLESVREHMDVFSSLTDRESEAILLLTFIPRAEGSSTANKISEAWREGNVEPIAAAVKNEYADFPAFAERIIDARNRNWMPKIERYLRSGQIWFVVVGAAHFGGPNGLLALLRARGYQIEQM